MGEESEWRELGKGQWGIPIGGKISDRIRSGTLPKDVGEGADRDDMDYEPSPHMPGDTGTPYKGEHEGTRLGSRWGK